MLRPLSVIVASLSVAITTVAQTPLAQRLDSVLMNSPLNQTSTLGIMVWDLDADTCVYSHNATKVLRPASTMKILTAVAALHAMGDSAVVRADMDGKGHLLTDLSMKDTVSLGEGWCWDDDNPQLNYRDTSLTQRPLIWLLHPMLKESNNLAAETVFYTLAAHQNNDSRGKRRPATSKMAQKAVGQFVSFLQEDAPWLQLQGEGMPLYRVADGSGLSLYNYVTPQLLLACLRYAWHDDMMRRALLATLPIAGHDGTLEKRMRDTDADMLVLAKTGTVSGVSSLAGYYLGTPLAFVIICNGVMRQQPARDLQDQLCVEMAEGSYF